MARERYLLNAGEDTIHQNEIKLVTGKDKRKNWWYYHKVHLLVGIIVVGLVGSFIYSMVTKVNPDYTIGLLTSYSMPSNGLDQLEQCITPYADDRNGDGQVVVTVVNYVYSDDADADATQQQAAVVRFLADASSNTCMIYLHDQEAFDALSRSDFGGLFQYNDGTAMPEDADDFENAMLSWDEIPNLSPKRKRATCTPQIFLLSYMKDCGFPAGPRRAALSSAARRTWPTISPLWSCWSA